MVAIKSVAHFSIPVSDITKCTRLLPPFGDSAGRANGFLDAAGACLILVKREPPIDP